MLSAESGLWLKLLRFLLVDPKRLKAPFGSGSVTTETSTLYMKRVISESILTLRPLEQTARCQRLVSQQGKTVKSKGKSQKAKMNGEVLSSSFS